MLFYFKLKILVLYVFAIIGLLLFLIGILIFSLFSDEEKEVKDAPTIDNLIQKINDEENTKEDLDGALKDFYSLFSNMSSENENYIKWIKFVKTISLLDYMDVKEVAIFRDELIAKNPDLKQEIEVEIANVLKIKESR